MGPKYNSSEFFHLLSYNYRTTVPGFKLEHGDCDASIVGATEGAIYPQHLTKNSTLFYWRKTLCRAATLYFEEEVQKGPLLGYKYVLRDDVYDHKDETKVDCYKGSSPTLPDGLSDLQKCFHSKILLLHIPTVHFDSFFSLQTSQWQLPSPIFMVAVDLGWINSPVYNQIGPSMIVTL